MYLIITSGLFIFSLGMLIYYLKQISKVNTVINKYRNKNFVAENIQEVLIRDYYRFCLDDEIEKNRDITCYSSLVDNVVTLELESKHFLLYIKIENNEVSYAVSALDDSFYQNIKELYGETLKTSVSRLEQYKNCPFSYFFRPSNLYKKQLNQKNRDYSNRIHYLRKEL